MSPGAITLHGSFQIFKSRKINNLETRRISTSEHDSVAQTISQYQCAVPSSRPARPDHADVACFMLTSWRSIKLGLGAAISHIIPDPASSSPKSEIRLQINGFISKITIRETHAVAVSDRPAAAKA